jgi:hypothetical protein
MNEASKPNNVLHSDAPRPAGSGFPRSLRSLGAGEHGRCASQKGEQMKRLALAAMLLAVSVASSAADPTPESISSQFFDALVKGDSAKAIDGFFGLNPMFKDKGQQLQLMKTQLAGAIQIYGPASAAELVSKEDLSPSLHRRVYITKHDFHPLTWEMYFYKAKSGWLPDQMLFVDQYQVLGSKK